MSVNYKTPDYFLDFTCLGGECEDTCCQAWEIKLDKKHYLKLQENMSANEGESTLFAQYIQINENPVIGDHDYAYITMAENGMCPMLGDDNLCSVHKQYGVEPLGNVCAFFPRVISRAGKNMELSGALSCPQVVRLCLLHEHPTRFVRFSPSSLPRAKNYPIQRDLPANPFDYYAVYFQPTRQTMLDIVAMESYKLDVRLYALAALSQHLSSYYHRDCQAPNEKKLTADLKTAAQEQNLNNISKFLQQVRTINPISLVVIRAVLEIKLTQFPQEKLSDVIKQVFDGIGDAAINAAGNSPAMGDLSAEDLHRVYAENRSRISGVLQTRLDHYLTRYLSNCLFREWYFTMPDTFTYIQMLLIRLAMLRFLLYSHPDLQQIACQQQSSEQALSTETIEALDRLAVYLVYNFARAVDQNLPFLQIVYSAVSEQQMMNFDYSLPFICI